MKRIDWKGSKVGLKVGLNAVFAILLTVPRAYAAPTPLPLNNISAATPNANNSEDPERIVAEVNGRPIRLRDVDKAIEERPMQSYRLKLQQDRLGKDKIRLSVLSSMIDQRLLLDLAEKSGAVSQEDITQEASKYIASQGGLDAWRTAISGQGITNESLKARLEGDLKIRSYVDKVLSKEIVVSDQEAMEFYNKNRDKFQQGETVKARHILVQVAQNAPKDAQDAAKRKIEEIYRDVTGAASTENNEGGSDGKKDNATTATSANVGVFEKIAKERSDCPSAKEGGDLGYFQRGAMVPEFEAIAFNQPINQVSQPFRTPFGWHILRVEDKRGPQTQPFDEVKGEIIEGLVEERKHEALQAKLTELKKNGAAKVYFNPS